MARATHYKPMLPNGIGSEPWLPLRGQWSFTGVDVQAIAPLGRGEYDVFYHRGETPCRMFVRVAGPEQLTLGGLFEAVA
jgi:hypothetical protein